MREKAKRSPAIVRARRVGNDLVMVIACEPSAEYEQVQQLLTPEFLHTLFADVNCEQIHTQEFEKLRAVSITCRELFIEPTAELNFARQPNSLAARLAAAIARRAE